MKKILALSVVVALCAIVVLAGDEKMGDKKMGGKAMEGTITKVDSAAKMMTVKDASGKEMAIYWNDSTKVAGDEMKEGAKVHWKGAEKDGKVWASWVHVGEMKKM
jgi:Cu/Ag efflux protein CusF